MGDLYRLTITYERTRPLWSLYYIHHILSRPNDGYFGQADDPVFEKQTVVIGPYDSIRTVKAQRGAALRKYPIADRHWPPEEIAEWDAVAGIESGPGYIIHEEKWEHGVETVVWEELDTPT